MTHYIIRVTDIAERKVFDIEQTEFDTIEECQQRAFRFWAQCYPLTKDDTKTTILIKSDPLEQIWSLSCFRLGVDGPWVYPEDLEEMSIL
jgi:hypothetical protein